MSQRADRRILERIDRRLPMRVVSVATAVVLTLELAAMLSMHATTWPFTAFTMFSHPRDEAIVVELVRRSAGDSAKLRAEELGFAQRNELYSYVRRAIVTVEHGRIVVRPHSREAARTIARLYEERNGSHVSRLDVFVEVTPVPRSDDAAARRRLALSVST